MAPDDHGHLKITETYLTDFINTKLQPFLDDFTSDPHRVELEGYTQDGKLGMDANWNYNQLLTGNSKGSLAVAGQLQAKFKTFATALQEKFAAIDTAARTMVQDMLIVDAVLNKSEDAANITAAEMSADLSNVSFGDGSALPPTGGGSNDGKNANS